MSVYRTRNSDISHSIKNSISDILPKKSPESIERSKFQQSQHASLIKAINNIETPVKEKHVRNIILGTCFEKSALPFWYSAVKLELYGNQIVCWKFCFTLHKLLRDGYSSCVNDSFRFVGTLEDLSKSWVHLKHGYGLMIYHYCNYLGYKIKFHKKNQLIPANLIIEDRNLEEIAANDINNYFQLCCDFFDYADEILALQNAVFLTMDRSRSNSMIESGQLKLAPLILAIQESNQLYDFCVKFMFKLHDSLPGDVLEGHRQRFLTLFKQLSKFYECCKNLQYFKNLISIPDLPSQPPNFRVKADFQSYSKPVMVVVEPTIDDAASTIEDDTHSVLVDFSDSLGNSARSATHLTPEPDEFQQRRLQEQRERELQHQEQQFQYIQSLLREIEHLRVELDRLSVESEFEVRSLRDKIKFLEEDLMHSKSECEQQKIKTENLEDKLKIISENEKAKADLDSLEKKAVSSEEKFNKMKELYNKLKEEHVALLRQEADVRKQKASLAESFELAKKVKTEFEKRLETILEEKNKLEASYQEKLKDLESLKTDNERIHAEQVSFNQKHLNEVQKFEQEKKELELNLEEYKKVIEDCRQAEKNSQAKLSIHEAESQNRANEAEKLSSELDKLTKEISNLKHAADEAQRSHQSNLFELRDFFLVEMLKNGEQVIKEALHLLEDPILYKCTSTADYLIFKLQPFNDIRSELINSFYKCQSQNECEKLNESEKANYCGLLRVISQFSNLLSETVVLGKITSASAGDVEKGEQLADASRAAGQNALELLQQMQNLKAPIGIEQHVAQLDENIKKTLRLLNELLPKVHEISKEEIGDLVENEMQKTSNAIEAAVAKLEALSTKTKEQDSGLKLEVNDKILDSCSSLMKAIKLLIIRSIELQKEIVAQGRGASSSREFYAKNHKWTEGLVTAAKLVGLGANVLIEKTDKFVSGNGKLEEIIVGSNEIAASTAQLVVASNVKADRDSGNRRALIEAKNDVSSATANLVASAKSFLKSIDDQKAMDFTKMSLHQTKMLEMEAQVKVLELEKLLEIEKNKLYKLRKQHYHLEENPTVTES